MTQNFEAEAGDRRKRLIRIFTFISLVGFLGQASLSGISTLKTILQQPSPTEQTQTAAVDQQTKLQAQERGYESVLTREPANPTALEGLANVRIQMNNPQGAIEPLEKLVQVYPNREDYKTLLAQMKAQ
ncbi:MAG: tetratricopeptide repeat protein [Oscillatoriales cyanobacterium RM2_1_1]|nr:tetratricopeptide repeat protein [Oscillatoriales cyanobacterium SM2_3_0]NJO47414.1 tetratricopeptide repeat protein [Oscillatoriales cyanobacterium RM2_1_1]